MAREVLPFLRNLRGSSEPSVGELLTFNFDTSTTNLSSLDCLPCGGSLPEALTFEAGLAVGEHGQPQPLIDDAVVAAAKYHQPQPQVTYDAFATDAASLAYAAPQPQAADLLPFAALGVTWLYFCGGLLRLRQHASTAIFKSICQLLGLCNLLQITPS